ncbi:MAG: hypothetical protein ACYC69_16150 [Thermodesulfovibrionales bacterium]
MSWDYRVIQSGGAFTIHEVHYNDQGDMTAVSEDPMGPSGETLEDLRDDMEYFLQALSLPVLKRQEITLAPMEEK